MSPVIKTPVAYTHLDVYKRQLVRRGIDLDELSGMGLTFAPMCAVSDFFLFRDVYKRQA